MGSIPVGGTNFGSALGMWHYNRESILNLRTMKGSIYNKRQIQKQKLNNTKNP